MSEPFASTARDIIAGRHADPFAYLGPHTENDETVVRVFLPDAQRVVAVGERGERELARIDPAGLFAGAARRPAALSAARAASATTRSSWKTLIVSRRCCPTTISICWAKATTCASTTSSARIRCTLDGVDGVGFVVWAPNARRVSVVGDFNFWDGRRHAMRVRGNGYWEIFVPGARADDKYKYEIVDARRPDAAAEVRPGRLRRRNAPRHGLRGRRRRQAAATGAGARQRQRARPADVDLRGPSRLLAAKRATRGNTG